MSWYKQSQYESHSINEYLAVSAEKGNMAYVKKLIEAGADVMYESCRAFRNACDAGNLEMAKYLVEAGSDVHARDDYAVRWASERGHFDIVKYVVEVGADIDAEDGWALSSAIEVHQNDIAKYLIEKGASVGEFSIMDAIDSENTEMVELLLSMGVKPTMMSLQRAETRGNAKATKLIKGILTGRHPFGYDKNAQRKLPDINSYFAEACRIQNIDYMKKLLENGAELDNLHWMHVLRVIKNGRLDILKLLRENGLIDFEGYLSAAAQHGQTEIAKYMISQGATVEQDGMDSAVDTARIFGHIELADYLAEQEKREKKAQRELPTISDYLDGAVGLLNIDYMKKLLEDGANTGEVSLSHLLLVIENDRIDILDLLVKSGLSIPEHSLIVAASLGKTEIVKYLLTKGFSADQFDRRAEHNARYHGHEELADFLSEQADLDWQYKGRLRKAQKRLPDINDYLMEAESLRNTEYIKALLKGGADPDYLCGSRSTTHWICKEGDVELLKILVERHYFELTRDSLNIAADNGHMDVVKYHIENGERFGLLRDILLRDTEELARWSGHHEVADYLLREMGIKKQKKEAQLDEDTTPYPVHNFTGYKFEVGRGIEILMDGFVRYYCDYPTYDPMYPEEAPVSEYPEEPSISIVPPVKFSKISIQYIDESTGDKKQHKELIGEEAEAYAAELSKLSGMRRRLLYNIETYLNNDDELWTTVFGDPDDEPDYLDNSDFDGDNDFHEFWEAPF